MHAYIAAFELIVYMYHNVNYNDYPDSQWPHFDYNCVNIKDLLLCSNQFLISQN